MGRMAATNLYYPTQLYKGIIYADGGNNQMMYLGMQNQTFTFPMFDAQALWSLQYILKNITIPCKADMLNHTKAWAQREREVKSANDFIDLQNDFCNFSNDYVLELQEEAGHDFKNFFEFRHLLTKRNDDKFNKDLSHFRIKHSRASLPEMNQQV